jgi:hypothetical protein
MYKRGDRVWSLSRGVAGEIRVVDSVNEPHYFVRWDDDTYARWEYSEDVEPLLDGTVAAVVEDMVNHPAHYNTGSIEVIDFIEDQGLEYHEASALKYIARAGKKSPDTRIQDLEKAVWYLNRKLVLLKGESDG